MKLFLVLVFTGVTSLAAFSSQSADLKDSFESADMSTTSAHGFKWEALNSTSIVTKDAVVWNGSIINKAKPVDRDWVPFEGDHSLRFYYSASKNMSEQRFDLGAAYPEVWIKFWLRVPINFKHGSDKSNNNKLLAIWMDGYETKGLGPTVVWQYRNDGQGGSVTPVYYWETVGNISLRTQHNGEKQSTPFISYPADQGRWMSLVFHLKSATSSNSNDGVIEMWRRWSDEVNYTKFHEINDAPISTPVGGPNGWSAGYIMGWANSPYIANTEFLLDEFTVSPTSLLESKNNVSAPANSIIEPPSNVVVIKKQTTN